MLAQAISTELQLKRMHKCIAIIHHIRANKANLDKSFLKMNDLDL